MFKGEYHKKLKRNLMDFLKKSIESNILLSHQILCQDMEIAICSTIGIYKSDPEVTVFEVHGDNTRTVCKVAEGVIRCITEFCFC